MTPERAKELLPVIEAFANGETVQFYDGETVQFYDGDEWCDVGKEGLDAETLGDDGLKYRIKPKPREFWMNLYSDGCVIAYGTKEAAEQHRGDRAVIIKVREVCE